MAKVFIGVLAFVIGLAVGGYGAMRMAGGAMMGAGAGVGLTTGICMVVEAANQTGLLDEAQIDEVMKRAAQNASGGELPEGMQSTGALKGCEEALAKLRSSQG